MLLVFFCSCMAYSVANPTSSEIIIKIQFDFCEIRIHFWVVINSITVFKIISRIFGIPCINYFLFIRKIKINRQILCSVPLLLLQNTSSKNDKLLIYFSYISIWKIIDIFEIHSLQHNFIFFIKDAKENLYVYEWRGLDLSFSSFICERCYRCLTFAYSRFSYLSDLGFLFLSPTITDG